MNPINVPATPKSDARGDAVARAGERSLEHAAQSAKPALDALIEDVGQVRADVRPALNEFGTHLEDLARSSARRLGEQAGSLRDRSATLVRNRPLQSMLIAAGVGAGLVLVLRLFARAAAGGR